MNFIKRTLLFLATLPMLFSCANNGSIAGLYGFQLGKESGTHFGVFLNLTDKKYTPSEQDDGDFEGYKNFTFSMSVKMQGSDEESSKAIESVLDYFKDETGTARIPGYYKLTNELNSYKEARIRLGLSFSYIVEKFLEISKEE